MTATTIDAPDLSAVKQRQQVMWASGDFHAVATLIQPVADMLCDAVDVQAGSRVLDVATGSGNAAIAAARSIADWVWAFGTFKVRGSPCSMTTRFKKSLTASDTESPTAASVSVA